jgi:hypothetical protein
MTTFRIEAGIYVPYSSVVIDDMEEQLENDLEQNPHVILAPEKLLFIGRQTKTPDGRALDLLAVTADRRPVIIELKKNRTPREMMAQALEYAAFIDRSSNDEINARAVEYFARTGKPWTSLRDAHEEFFEGSVIPTPERTWDLANSPIIVLEGQTIATQIIDVAFYLRKHDIDVRVAQFSYQAGPAGERLVTVVQLLGAENDAGPDTLGVLRYEEMLESGAAAGIFKSLCAGLNDLGLVENRTAMGISFRLPGSGGTVASVWLSSKRERAYLQVYARWVPSGLDAFDTAVRGLGFNRERHTNISVHVYPTDAERLRPLMDAFLATCLGASSEPAA